MMKFWSPVSGQAPSKAGCKQRTMKAKSSDEAPRQRTRNHSALSLTAYSPNPAVRALPAFPLSGQNYVCVHSRNAEELPRGCRVWRLVWLILKLLPAATSLLHCCCCSSGSYCTTVWVSLHFRANAASASTLRKLLQNERWCVQTTENRKVKLKLRKCISISQLLVKTEV